jgi:hypothetical protein
MTDLFIDTLDFSDWQTTRPDAIDLRPDQIAQAREVAWDWSQYLTTLADLSFAEWLQSRSENLPQRQIQPGLWEINGFRVATIASSDETEVLMPQLARDLPANACHLYVAITILEEQQQVYIGGSLRYDQLMQGQWEQSEGEYVLPIDHWAADTNQLLLTLRCAEPASIPLPQAATANQANQSISQSVQAQSVQTMGQQLGESARQGLLSARNWINRQLDNAADELAWVLMPPLAPQMAMRSTTPSDPLTTILPTLTQQGIVLPEDAQAAYQELNVTSPALRLYAIVGTVSPMEWSLLIVIGQVNGETLPATLKLNISDGQTDLVQQQVEVARSQTYLYAQVIGDRSERFQVSLTWPDGVHHTLPEFVY